MIKEILPNIVAMIFSFVAIVQLALVAPKIGGIIGRVLKLLIVGIFFSVFVHAGFELAEIFNIINKEFLLFIMGILISVGSIFFSIAGFIAVKAFKK